MVGRVEVVVRGAERKEWVCKGVEERLDSGEDRGGRKGHARVRRCVEKGRGMHDWEGRHGGGWWWWCGRGEGEEHA